MSSKADDRPWPEAEANAGLRAASAELARLRASVRLLQGDNARLRALAIEFARGHACDSADFDAFAASLGRDNF